MFLQLSKITVAAVISMAFTVQASEIWMTGGDGTQLYKVDSSNGLTTAVGNFGQSATYAVAFDSANTLYGISNGFSNGTLVTIDKSTGLATNVGVATGVSDLMALAFAQDGTLYAGSWATNDLYKIDKHTGAATIVGNLGFGGIMDLDFDSHGNLYGLSDALYQVDLVTGHGTKVTNLGNSCLMGMAIDQHDNFYATDYCTGNTPLYQINTANGALTNLGPTAVSNAMGGAIENDAVVDVPEPGTISIFGVALFGFLWTRRRTQAK